MFDVERYLSGVDVIAEMGALFVQHPRAAHIGSLPGTRRRDKRQQEKRKVEDPHQCVDAFGRGGISRLSGTAGLRLSQVSR